MILKFRFVTLTPNINSQTFWPKVISHVTNGTIFFICSASAISALLAVLRMISWPKMMAKRMQEQKEEERIVSKPKSTANLSSHVPASSSTAEIPIASKSPGILTATGKTESRMRRKSKSDAASCSQVKLQDAYLGGLMEKVAGKPVATDESQELWEFSESETWSLHEEELTEKPVAYKTVTGKLVASSKSDQPGSPKAERKEWPHNLHISPATVHHMEAVFSIVRNI